MSCGVGRRHGSDLALLWLWLRLAATALIRPLAWKLPYDADAHHPPPKKKKRQNKKGEREHQFLFYNDFYFFHYNWFTAFCQFLLLKEKDKYHMISLLSGISYTWWTFPQKRNSWTWRTDLWLPKGRGREWDGLGEHQFLNIYQHITAKEKHFQASQNYLALSFLLYCCLQNV